MGMLEGIYYTSFFLVLSSEKVPNKHFLMRIVQKYNSIFLLHFIPVWKGFLKYT